MTLSGLMGFSIGLVTVMQVKATSPLTHNISGTAKAAVQSLLAFYLWGNQATVQGILGIFLVLLGSGLYTWIQMKTSSSQVSNSATTTTITASVPVAIVAQSSSFASATDSTGSVTSDMAELVPLMRNQESV